MLAQKDPKSLHFHAPNAITAPLIEVDEPTHHLVGINWKPIPKETIPHVSRYGRTVLVLAILLDHWKTSGRPLWEGCFRVTRARGARSHHHHRIENEGGREGDGGVTQRETPASRMPPPEEHGDPPMMRAFAGDQRAKS